MKCSSLKVLVIVKKYDPVIWLLRGMLGGNWSFNRFIGVVL